MELTVNEALNLKNQIAHKIRINTSGYSIDVSYGVTKVDGEERENTLPKFEDFYSNLNRLFKISNEINTILAKFNTDNKVGEIARGIKNNEVKLRMVDLAVNESVVTKHKEYVGKNDKEIVREFKPFQNKSELKVIAKELRKANRELQSQLYTVNAKKIALSFEYDEVEELIA